MNSIDPSVDPLSETMTSKSSDFVPWKIDRKQSEITFRSFQHRMTMDSFIKWCNSSFKRSSVDSRQSIYRGGTPRRRTTSLRDRKSEGKCTRYQAKRLDWTETSRISAGSVCTVCPGSSCE